MSKLVATNAKADPGYRDGHTWTLSFDPDIAGWHHDGGYAGYGLPEALAKEIAARYNAHDRLRSALEKCEGALKEAESALLLLSSPTTALKSCRSALAAAEEARGK